MGNPLVNHCIHLKSKIFWIQNLKFKIRTLKELKKTKKQKNKNKNQNSCFSTFSQKPNTKRERERENQDP